MIMIVLELLNKSFCKFYIVLFRTLLQKLFLDFKSCFSNSLIIIVMQQTKT